MNKYLAVLVFYGISILVIFILSKLSPTAHDGGPGFGDLAFLSFSLVVVALFIFNVYKGFAVDKSYFIVAGIHLLVVLYLFFFRFR